MTTKGNLTKRAGFVGAYCSIIILIIVSVLAITGCDKSPLQPELSAELPTPELAHKSTSFENNIKCFESSGLVTAADGGIVRLGWGGRKNSLRVKPGAVEKDVVIEITSCVPKGNRKNKYSAIELDFGPSGLTFSKPAKLVLNAGFLNALRSPIHKGVVKLYYYDPDTDEWLFQQEAKVRNGKIIFKISHFSKFGISH